MNRRLLVKSFLGLLLPTLCEPVDCIYSPWSSLGQNTGVVAVPFSRGSSQPRDQNGVSHVAGGFFTT